MGIGSVVTLHAYSSLPASAEGEPSDLASQTAPSVACAEAHGYAVGMDLPRRSVQWR